MKKNFVKLTPISDDFGDRLQAIRESKGLSLRDLAFPGCSSSYISRLENGMRSPSLQIVLILAHIMGVHPRELGVHEWVSDLFTN